MSEIAHFFLNLYLLCQPTQFALQTCPKFVEDTGSLGSILLRAFDMVYNFTLLKVFDSYGEHIYIRRMSEFMCLFLCIFIFAPRA